MARESAAATKHWAEGPYNRCSGRDRVVEARNRSDNADLRTGSPTGMPGAITVTTSAPGAPVLTASLLQPAQPEALVVIAHGSGSDRFSPRNGAVAARLQQAGLACLLPDLLTSSEARQEPWDGGLGCRIPLLAERLLAWIDWAALQPPLASLPIGLYGASTGAAVALTAAAVRAGSVAAVVCRGGRPDLARAALPLVRCPVLLIVGERDREVLRLNRLAALALRGPHKLALVPGAGHLFEEAGSLTVVSDLTLAWYTTHLRRAHRPDASHFHTSW